MLYLSGLRRRPLDDAPDDAGFPLSLPLIRDLDAITFTTPAMFLVGENGSGKSTLPEGIAAGIGAVAVGGHDLARDPSPAPPSCRPKRAGWPGGMDRYRARPRHPRLPG